MSDDEPVNMDELWQLLGVSGGSDKIIGRHTTKGVISSDLCTKYYTYC